MLENLLGVLVEFLVIVGVFIAPAAIWHRLVTGSWNMIDPDLRR